MPGTEARADWERQLQDLLQKQRALTERLRQGQARFRGLARAVWRVQEDERRRLARELHDGVGQNLTAVINLIGLALRTPDDKDGGRRQLEQALAVAEATLAETRALSRLLRPQILDDLGLAAALRWLGRSVGEANALAVDVDIHEPLPPLDDDIATMVFRVAQEALTNVVRHAAASRADVGLHRDGDELVLQVRDDGRGCNVRAALAAGSEGVAGGLGGMRERVQVHDGELQIQSRPGAGFTIVAKFPLRVAKGTLPP